MSSVGLLGICSRARQAASNIRARLTGDGQEEQCKNFAPYIRKRKAPSTPGRAQKKANPWSVRIVCLASRFTRSVPTSGAEKGELINAGLGEKKIPFQVLNAQRKSFKSS